MAEPSPLLSINNLTTIQENGTTLEPYNTLDKKKQESKESFQKRLDAMKKFQDTTKNIIDTAKKIQRVTNYNKNKQEDGVQRVPCNNWTQDKTGYREEYNLTKNKLQLHGDKT